MATILIDYGVPMEGFCALQGHDILCPPPYQQFTQEEMLAYLPKADAMCSCKTLSADMIAVANKLQLIVCYGAGYDAIDVQAASAKGIKVCNVPQTVTTPTAETAFTLLCMLAKRIPLRTQQLKTQDPNHVFVLGKDMGTSIDGATLGIVGMGRIGQKMADFGRAFGMKILYHSRSPKPQCDALGDCFVDLDTLLTQADFVSLHCPHTPNTTHLLSDEKLALMKPSAYLINTARGAVVDEDALICRLQNGQIAGAGLDVFQGEPHFNPVWLTLDSVILTPHIGSNTVQARYQMGEIISKQILTVLSGGTPEHWINP